MSWLKGTKVMTKKENSFDPAYEEPGQDSLVTGFVMQWSLYGQFEIVLINVVAPNDQHTRLDQRRDDGMRNILDVFMWRWFHELA